MTEGIKKLFVYGTFLQGEPLNHHLRNCKLIQAMEIPGKLYNTGKGYPAALFDCNPKETVAGEIYYLSGDSDKKLKELDEVEGTRLNLYRRKELRHKAHLLYLYEAGEGLKGYLKNENTINSGSWRRKGSVALKDPPEFALAFEKQQEERYREFPPKDSSGMVFLKGDIPILVTAPHATRHLRMNKLKEEEEYTGAISLILHALTGSHALYTHWASRIDPNFYDESPFKKKLTKVIRKFGIRFVLDLHGTRVQRGKDIYPGIGNNREFLIGNDLYLDKFEEVLVSNEIILGSLHVFPASIQMTVTKFVATKLGAPAMQIEINERLREPEGNPKGFEKLIDSLTEYINYIKS
ncbi:MAG: gamma-glutamylcyclotransferase [Candidatus Dadabacteria bacterium]|nr:gamma-glutamylcyclotransferase [Candidatus Dadabacteria bacterium]